MSRISIFVVLAMVFGLFFIAGAQSAAAQEKPVPDVKEKKAECDDEDGDDDEDLTEADRASVKISIRDAKLIALGRVPGKIMDAELEKERGRLQYAFDILGDDGKTYDVEIDAITGEILQAEPEDDDDDDGPAAKIVVKKKVIERKVVVATRPQ